MRFRSLRYLALAVSIVIVYFGAAELGLSLASVHTNVSPVWPPTGIAIAALLLFGKKLWPAIFLGALAANLKTGVSTPTAAGIAIGNTLEAVLAFYLLQGRFNRSFGTVRDVLRFLAFAVVLSPMASATIGNTSLCLGGAASWNAFGRLWLTWWLGDGFGAMVMAPFLLAWFDPVGPRMDRKRVFEATLLLTGIALTAMVVLGGWFPKYPLEHLCLPFILWAALRFDRRVVTSAVILLSGMAVWGTSNGYGPFAQSGSNESLLLLQVFIGSITLTALILFAVMNERRNEQEEKEKLGAEIELQRRRLEDILTHVPGVVWEAWGLPDSAAQRIGFVSGHVETMLGYSRSEWLETPNFWLTIVHPEDRERAAREAAAIFASRKGGTSRFRWLAKDHTELWVEAWSVVVCDDRGRPIGMRGVTMDISPAVRAEQDRLRLLESERQARAQAEEASRLRDEFLATVSHELRTPLSAVVGWSRLLRSGQLDAEGSSHALEVIERNAWAQKQIIEDLLDVSRIIAGKLRLTFISVDLLSVMHSAIDVVRPAAEAKQIYIATHIEAPELIVRGDPDRLQQVAWNLLANAVKFTPSDGRIDVILRRKGNNAEIIVTDTGPGIAESFLPRAFERFSQADSSTTRKHGGLGLGLAIVRHVLELHGGTVKAANRQDGNGAIFTVELALAERPHEFSPTISAETNTAIG